MTVWPVGHPHDPVALFHDAGSSGTVDGAVAAAAAARQRRIGGIDDGVHFLLGDVSALELDYSFSNRRPHGLPFRE